MVRLEKHKKGKAAMSKDKIRELVKKYLEYPIGRETSFAFGSGTDPVSLARRIVNLETEMSIMIREVDLIIRTVHSVAEKHDDAAIRSLSDKLKV